MRAIPFQKPCAAKDLRIVDWPTPQITPNSVLIEVKAFGLNFADIMARKGQYNDAPKFPFVPGYEVSGLVKAIGNEVKSVKVGDAVLALTHFGGYAEFALAEEQAIVKKPDALTFAEAASIPVNFLTAYHALFETGTFLPNAQVLIHAGAGGVGLSAIQLARNAGATIFSTAGSEEKLDLLRTFGVKHAINYRTHDFENEVLRILGSAKLDVVLDSVGGASFKKDLALLRAHGRVVGYGAAALSERNLFALPKIIPQVLSMLTLSMIDLMLSSKSFCGVNMLRVAQENPELIQHELKQIMDLFAAKKVKTVISKELPWSQIAEAHSLLEGRHSTGKIVLIVQ